MTNDKIKKVVIQLTNKWNCEILGEGVWGDRVSVWCWKL